MLASDSPSDSTASSVVVADQQEDQALALELVIVNTELASGDATGTPPPLTVEARLDAALNQVWSELANRAGEAGFLDLLLEVFSAGGSDATLLAQQAQDLATRLAGGDQLGLRYEIESDAEMAGVAGAYAQVGDDGVPTIYINGEWLKIATDAELRLVLLEEIAHSFDPELRGGIDTAGDEGELFAKLFSGMLLTEEQRAAIGAENEQTNLIIDGQQVLVEEATATTAGPLIFTEQAAVLNSYAGSIVNLFTNTGAAKTTSFTAAASEGATNTFKIVVSNYVAGDRLSVNSNGTNLTSNNPYPSSGGQSNFEIILDGSTTTVAATGWATAFGGLISVSGTVAYVGTTATVTLAFVAAGNSLNSQQANATAFKDKLAGSMAFWSISDNPTAHGVQATRSVAIYDTETSTTAQSTANVSVVGFNDSPLLNAANFSPQLTSLNTNSGVPVNGSMMGQSIATFINASQLVGGVITSQITDPDSTALGIAITAVNPAAGSLYFSTNGGTTWTAVGAVSPASALLLRSEDRLYLASASVAGSYSDVLMFKAWDQSAGSAGTKVDTTTAGLTAYSTASDTVAVTLTEPGLANNAPSLSDTSVFLTTVLSTTAAPSNGSTAASTLVSTLVGGIADSQTALQISSGNPTPSTGIAITAIHSGTLYVSTNNGASWSLVTGVSEANALLLLADASTRVAYVPAGTASPANAFSFRAWDNTGSSQGLAGTYVNLGAYSIDGSFSSASDGVQVNVVVGTSATFSENGNAADPLGTLYNATHFAKQSTPLVIRVVGVSPGDQLTLATGSDTSISLPLQTVVGITPLGSLGDYAVAVDGATTTITLTGMTAANKALVVNGLTFFNTRDDISTGSRNVTISENASTVALGQIFVVGINDAPVLADAPLTYPAITANNAAPVDGVADGAAISTLVSSATLTDADGPPGSQPRGIAITAVAPGLKLYFSTNGGASWALATLEPGFALLLADDPNSRFYLQDHGSSVGVTISHALTLMAWDQSAGLNGTLVSWSAAGTGAASPYSSRSDTVSVTVNADNTPHVDLNASDNGINRASSFTEAAVAVAFTSSGTNFNDLDSSSFQSIQVSFDLANFPDGNSEKLLIATHSFDLTTAFTDGASGRISVAPNTYDWSSTVSGSTTTLTFTGPDGAAISSKASVEALLDALHYQNTSAAPTTGSGRIFSISALDDTNLSSRLARYTVSVTGVNNPPSVDAGIADTMQTEGLPFAYQFNAAAFQDPDLENLSYRATQANGDPLPAWLTFNAAERRFYGAPPKSSPDLEVSVIAADPSGATATDTFVMNTVSKNLNPLATSNSGFAYLTLGAAFPLVNAANFSSSGFYERETNDFQTAAAPLRGSNFVFYQETATPLNGNNVLGWLAYNDSNGNVVRLRGEVTRPVKSPQNSVEGAYLWVEDPNANGPYQLPSPNPHGDPDGSSDNQAYVLSFGDYFQGNQMYGSSSDRLDLPYIGSNQGPQITTSDAGGSGSVIEAGNNDDGTVVAGLPTTSGLLTATDADQVSGLLWSIVNPPSTTYGAIEIQPSTGAWTYLLNNSDPDTQALAEAESVVETFTAQVIDADGATATQAIRVTILGSNDSPDLTVQAGDLASHAFTEQPAAPGVASSRLTIQGSLSVRDLDASDNVDILIDDVDLVGSGNQGSGLDPSVALSMFTLTAGDRDNAAAANAVNNLSWSFDSGSVGFDDLAAGETQQMIYKLKAIDSHGASDTQTVVITITGTNDLAVISGSDSGVVIEKGGASFLGGSGSNNSYGFAYTGIPDLLNPPDANYATTTGSLAVTDLDHDQQFVGPQSAASVYGSFAITSSGQWSYTLAETNPAVEALGKGETKIETFTVFSIDGSASQAVTITIQGADDVINEGAASFVLNGTPQVGSSLTAALAVNDPDGNGSAGFSYQWQSSADQESWSNLSGATANSYAVLPSDQRRWLRLRVDYVDAQGFTESVFSDAVFVPDLTPPELQAAWAGPHQIALSFSEPMLLAGGFLDTSLVQVRVNGSSRLVSAAQIDPADSNRVLLTLGGEILDRAASLSVAYTAPAASVSSGFLADLYDNRLASLGPRTITEYRTPISNNSLGLGETYTDLILTGSDAIDGTGNGAANRITGNPAANGLDGRAGADLMRGGAGNDTYSVDHSGDITLELVNQGLDTVRSSLSWTLADHLENLVLLGSTSISGIGNGLANSISGNSGNNSLDGAAGADQLSGGAGSDTYLVDNLGDVVIELADQGSDTVLASLSWTLADHLETLTLTGSELIDGTGNGLTNTITGNSAANRLDGGAGRDRLVGGAGNDTYVVDMITDTPVELAGEGSDTVIASVSWSLGDHLEHLTLTGAGPLSGLGNSLPNILIGNSGGNILDGGNGGTDRLTGGSGTDQFRFSSRPASFAATDADRITDFSASDLDRIRLARTAFGIASTTPVSLSSVTTQAVATALSTAVLFVYNSDSGELFWNQDGAIPGAGSGGVLAVLENTASLGVGQFTLY